MFFAVADLICFISGVLFSTGIGLRSNGGSGNGCIGFLIETDILFTHFLALLSNQLTNMLSAASIKNFRILSVFVTKIHNKTGVLSIKCLPVWL